MVNGARSRVQVEIFKVKSQKFDIWKPEPWKSTSLKDDIIKVESQSLKAENAKTWKSESWMYKRLKVDSLKPKRLKVKTWKSERVWMQQVLKPESWEYESQLRVHLKIKVIFTLLIRPTFPDSSGRKSSLI